MKQRLFEIFRYNLKLFKFSFVKVFHKIYWKVLEIYYSNNEI